MLSRKLAGSASFVCLRCRLQLARSPRLPPFAVVALSSISPLRYNPRRQQQQRSLGSHARLPDTNADEPARQSDAELLQDNGDDDPGASVSLNTHGNSENAADKPSRPTNSHAAVDPDADTDAEPGAGPLHYPFVRPPDLGQSYEPPAPQLYKSRGRLVSPNQEGLSIDILGKPGFAVVLREREHLEKQRGLPKPEPQELDPEGQVDPASYLMAEKDAGVTREEVLLNIHELKPTDSVCLSVADFDALKKTLLDGFTSPQLADYINEDRESRRFSGEVENRLIETPWVLELQPWTLLTSGATDRDPGAHLSGYIANARSRKERLAVLVMRECWDVGSKADVDRDGFASLTLRDVEFSILTVGTRRWLEGMSRPILAQVKEVRFVRESRTVNIVAPRYPTRLILERIEQVLSNCRTAEFPVALVSPEPHALDPGVLDEIGRVTNTVTRFDSSGEKIAVTWHQMSARDEARESAAQTVLRFLRKAYGPTPHVSTNLDMFPQEQPGHFTPILNCANKLPWHERGKEWARFSGFEHRAVYVFAPDIVLPLDLLPIRMGPTHAVGQPEGSFASPGVWSRELQTDTNAVFGHIGWSPLQQGATSVTLPLDRSLPRTFVPILPALSSLSLPSNLHEHGLWHTTTIIRFTPTPDTPPKLAASAPTLELRIDADHREINSLTSLRAIKHTHTGDVMVPLSTVDFRLTQQLYFELSGSVTQTHVPALTSFLAKSDLRPWESKFSTPPGLSGVRLPRRMFSPIYNDRIYTYEGASNDSDKDDNSDPVELDYDLASVELHRDVTAEYQGLKLRYTRVRAGVPGGEWSQISLDGVRVAPRPNKDEFVPEDIVPADVVGMPSNNSKRKFLSHTANKPSRKRGGDYTAHPATSQEFLDAVWRIAKGVDDLKWIVQRW